MNWKYFENEGKLIHEIFQIAFGENSLKIPLSDAYPRSLLVTGASGIGKTELLSSCCKEFQVQIIKPRLYEKSEKAVAIVEQIQEALLQTPCVVFLELDMFIKNLSSTTWLESMLLSQYLKQFEEQRVSEILLIGNCEDPRSLWPELRKSFEMEFRLNLPSLETRRLIFRNLLQGNRRVASDVDLDTFSDQCYGFQPSHIEACVSLALEAAFEENSKELELKHFIKAKKLVRDTLIGDYIKDDLQSTIEGVEWNDIGGLVTVKKRLKDAVSQFHKQWKLLKQHGFSPSKGAVLYGPPGTGKTMLARAIATECQCNFLPISLPTLIKGEIGESEKVIAGIFQNALKLSPCILFLDEIECVFSKNISSEGGEFGTKLVSQIILELDQLDNYTTGVIILAATNYIELVNDSLLRPGRLDQHIHVPEPNEQERWDILKVLARRVPFSSLMEPGIELMEINQKSLTGFTGADLKSLVKHAALNAIRSNGSNPQELKIQDFKAALIERTKR